MGLTGDGGRRFGSRLARIGLPLAGLLIALGFAALGTWQVQRRAWKRDLIARVERRLAAAPVPAPGPAEWAGVTRAGDEYRRVRVTGRFLTGHDTFVFASTRLGAGYWLMTPLRDARGFTLLVNRGFVPMARPAVATPDGPEAITGLLRLTEPGGDMLRRNAPDADRWYSRDVPAIAAARGLGTVAPYFVDAPASDGPDVYPHGGLTVIAFADNHLAYAVTWYVLAAMTVVGSGLAIRHGRR